MVGLDGISTPENFIERVRSFDSIVSWNGHRPEFRWTLAFARSRELQFHQPCRRSKAPEHAVDFFARQVGGPVGLVPRISISSDRKRVLHRHSSVFGQRSEELASRQLSPRRGASA